MLENFKNLYEVRKTIRFELKPYKKTREILKLNNNYKNLDSYIKHIKDCEFEEWFNWNIFCISEYENFLIESEKYFLLLQFINKNQKKSLFFDFKKSKGIFKNIPSLKNIDWINPLKQKFKEIEIEYKNYFDFFEKIKDIKEKNIKKSEVSINLRKIAYLNRNILTIFNFFDIYKTDKEILYKYKKIKNNINFEKINNSIIASHENEVNWACFWRFTLNKFSLFRRETNFLKEKFENNKKILQKNVIEMINYGIFDDNWKKIDIKIETINSLNLKKENFDFERNIDEVISELDNINSELLNQYIQEFKNNYKKNKNIISWKFEKFSENWKEKNNYHKKANIFLNNINIEIKPKKWQSLEWFEYLNLLWEQLFEEKDKKNQKLANKFLQILFKEEKLNPDYNTIKNFRDKLSKYRWELRQNLRVSEREFIQEAMIKYYWWILEKNWNYFLILFDKNNLNNDIKNIDKELKIFDNKGNLKNYFKIYEYSQLSFSALEKLCLSEDWDLIKNKSLIKKWNKYKNQKKDIDVKCELFYKDKKEHWIKTKWICEECKNKTEIEKEKFFKDFKEHILSALKNLENNKEYRWENWLELLEWIKKQKSIEKIVNFINQNFYKFESKYVEEDNIYNLAESWKILLFQIYNKDFNILNENFISEEENINENEKNIWEKTKIIDRTKREKWKKENLFTIYFKNIFKRDLETFLWQEWWLFFRKANLENDKKRFKNNKFFISFDIIFNKWKQNHNWKLCEKKDNILEKHIKKFKNLILNDKIIKNSIFIWIDRWEKEHISFWFYDNNMIFQWIIWNSNFVEKISKKNSVIKYSILLNSKFWYNWFYTDNVNELYSQIKLKNCYFDEKWIEEKWVDGKCRKLELNWLKDYHIKKIFKKDDKWNFFTSLENWWKFILLNKKYWYKIIGENNEEIKLKNELWNEVIDYYLLFEAEKYKRILDINNELKYSINMNNLKKWYLSIIKNFFKEKINDFQKEWKYVFFVFENQTSNKKDISNKYLWATILSEIEENLINQYNYLSYKDFNLNLQLSPNIIKKDILFKNNNIYDFFWNFIFVNQDNTSSACPVCNNKLIEMKKWNIVENKNINKLFWHWKWAEFENSMHHYSENNGINYRKSIKEAKKTKNDKCDYNIKNNPKWFDFIKSWDDLATYNIAKKAKEYLENLIENKNQ